MTLAEYMDPERFPLTTLAGAAARKQLVLDAVNLTLLREYLAEGGALDAELRPYLAELEAKERARAALTPEVREEGLPGTSRPRA